MNKKDVMNIEGLFILSAIARNSGKRQASKEYNTSVDTINKYIDNLENFDIYMYFFDFLLTFFDI